MNNNVQISIAAIIAELRSSTNLDSQEYKDFFVSVFFVLFILIHRRELLKQDSLFVSELVQTLGDEVFFSKLLKAATHVDELYDDALGLSETIEHLITRGREINSAAFRRACISLYGVVSDSELYCGDTFEAIIQFFSEMQGRRASEAYTPRDLVEMMVEIVEPRGGEIIYDPVCGSGGFLVSANIKASNIDADSKLKTYGREINLSAARIAKINCIVHDIFGSDIRISDSLQDLEVSAYDIILANPPFSLATESYGRRVSDSYFDFGIPPQNNADFAFLQMIIKSLKPEGRAAVLVSNGVLFRGGIEGVIREKIIQSGIVEAVIALPGGALKNTMIPTAILVLRKSRLPKSPILLIDSAEAERHVNTGLASSLGLPFSSTLEKYKKLIEVDGVSRFVTADELESNSYSLNVSRYIIARQAHKKSLSDLTKTQRELEVRLATLQRDFSHLLSEHKIGTQ
ncbi:class I SAM-dependent DNA methyltransferase [Pseudomonas sp. Larv2_ips]|uniref:HsdM family class I SAM-dependent methyltransferase n=1 Tax=Pseudomonas sp. Larv2_ips TaxID=1896942 RepID=UPI000E6C0901|nr:N-6 DNA methylase [Pseudomonas sp. Larv2_ips]